MKFSSSKALFLTLSLSSCLMACESKFVESAPNEQTTEGMNLDDRMSKKNDLDAKSKEVQKSAEKIRNILDLFRKVRNPKLGENVYTPIDLLIDISKELEGKIPESKEDTLIRRSKLEIPIDLLSKDCRTVDVMSISTSTYVEKEGQREVSKERVSHLMKTCGSNGQFVEIFVSEWNGRNMEFQFFNKNLEQVWNQVVFTDKLEDSACKVEHDQDKILQSIYCKDFYIQVSVSERAHVKKLTFSNTEEIRFFTEAEIFENGILKANVKLTVPKDGERSLEVREIK